MTMRAAVLSLLLLSRAAFADTLTLDDAVRMAEGELIGRLRFQSEQLPANHLSTGHEKAEHRSTARKRDARPDAQRCTLPRSPHVPSGNNPRRFCDSDER